MKEQSLDYRIKYLGNCKAIFLSEKEKIKQFNQSSEPLEDFVINKNDEIPVDILAVPKNFFTEE